MKTIERILEKIGLTKQETRVYLALLELQETKTGQLCKYTKIASSNIYKILDSLIKKGLISYRVQNNIKVYMPAPPDALNELFLKKQRTLEQERKDINMIIAQLKRKKIEKEPYSNYKYYEGIAGIKSMWYEINEMMNKKTPMKIYTAKKEGYQRFLAFYDEHHKLRKKKQVREQLIFPKEEKHLAKKRKDKLTEIKFLDLQNEAEWGIIDDKLFIQYITTKAPRAFLITDKTFSNTFKQVFNQLWKNAKQLL